MSLRVYHAVCVLQPHPYAIHSIFFFFNDTATTEIYTLSLHDALPISRLPRGAGATARARGGRRVHRAAEPRRGVPPVRGLHAAPARPLAREREIGRAHV